MSQAVSNLFRARRAVAASLLCSTMLASAAAAAEIQSYDFNLPREPLGQALADLGRLTGEQLIYAPELVRGRTAPAVKGRMAADAALRLVLQGSGLEWRRGPSGGLMIVPAGGGASPGSAGAAEGAAAPSGTVAAVVVTGTHIGGAGPVGAAVTVVDQAAMRRLGRSNAADLLRTLPENVSLGYSDEARGSIQSSPQNLGFAVSPNLRGLGVDATLSLVDGVRMPPTSYGGIVDVSQIPLIALDRVEVLADGASAVYGSDAVGGVVNFILKHDVDGGEAQVRAGAADGLDEQTYDVAQGRTWSSGSVFGALEYEHRSRLAAASRSYFTDDLRPYGGPDLQYPYASPGTLSVAGATYPIPTGQDGIGLTPAQLVAGPPRVSDRWEAADILPSIRRLSAAFDLRQELSPWASLFLEAVGQSRESEKRDRPYMTTLVVPKTNPFFVSPVAGASAVNVAYSFIGDLGPMAPAAKVQDVLLTGGLKFRMGHSWRSVVQGTFAHDRVNYFYDSLPNFALLAQALANPNPAAAFNPFGDRGSNAPSVVNSIRGYISNRSHLSYGELAANASGPLFRAPGGEVMLAVGLDLRHENLLASNATFVSRATPSLSGFEGARDVQAAYAEADVPIVGPDNARPGLRSLIVSAALRSERYSDAGSTTNPRLGLDWSPTSDLKISAAWGTSFKAPSLYQRSTALNGITVSQLPYAGAASGLVYVMQLYGNAPGLAPEKATTWSVGADWSPAKVSGLDLGLHYFSVRYRDRILDPTGAEVAAALAAGNASSLIIARSPSEAQVQAYYADPQFIGSFKPPAGEIFAIVDTRSSNLGAVEQSGLDFQARYSRESSVGRLGATLEGVYITRYAVERMPGQPFVSLRNTNANPIAWRGDAALTWSRGAWDGMLRANYVGGYANTTVTPSQSVSDWTTVDAHVGYAPSAGFLGRARVRAALDVQNLFDRDPPHMANVPAAVGYDTEAATALGRMVSITLSKRW